MHAHLRPVNSKLKAIFNNLIPITLSEKEIITSSIEPPSPMQHLRRGAPFFNLPRGAKTPSSVCTPGVCHPGYATVTLTGKRVTPRHSKNWGSAGAAKTQAPGVYSIWQYKIPSKFVLFCFITHSSYKFSSSQKQTNKQTRRYNYMAHPPCKKWGYVEPPKLKGVYRYQMIFNAKYCDGKFVVF